MDEQKFNHLLSQLPDAEEMRDFNVEQLIEFRNALKRIGREALEEEKRRQKKEGGRPKTWTGFPRAAVVELLLVHREIHRLQFSQPKPYSVVGAGKLRLKSLRQTTEIIAKLKPKDMWWSRHQGWIVDGTGHDLLTGATHHTLRQQFYEVQKEYDQHIGLEKMAETITKNSEDYRSTAISIIIDEIIDRYKLAVEDKQDRQKILDILIHPLSSLEELPRIDLAATISGIIKFEIRKMRPDQSFFPL